MAAARVVGPRQAAPLAKHAHVAVAPRASNTRGGRHATAAAVASACACLASRRRCSDGRGCSGGHASHIARAVAEGLRETAAPWPNTPASGRRSGEPVEEALKTTLLRVLVPTAVVFFITLWAYTPIVEVLEYALENNPITGPNTLSILRLLGMDESQFMQNFLIVNGLLFTLLCGDTYRALYDQQDKLYQALFQEVSEAKSLLEQSCLLCQHREFYRQLLQSISSYIHKDLRRLNVRPTEKIAGRPADDPLEYAVYVTSIGVPSVISDTVIDLRQARGKRLSAMQQKQPAIHFALLYVLAGLELIGFPLQGAGIEAMASNKGSFFTILHLQALLFASMSAAIVMTLQIIYELWRPFGGAYTAEATLRKMVRGLDEELQDRLIMASMPLVVDTGPPRVAGRDEDSERGTVPAVQPPRVS